MLFAVARRYSYTVNSHASNYNDNFVYTVVSPDVIFVRLCKFVVLGRRLRFVIFVCECVAST